ncbi:hypothetical protein RDABS01_001158 [Bienertia sinuspersici]
MVRMLRLPNYRKRCRDNLSYYTTIADRKMDKRLRQPKYRKRCSNSLIVDRLTNLPVDLLIHILSFLPTKDAVATCVLSKRMRHLFPWVTSLNLYNSSICHCLKHFRGFKRFSSFVTFVDSVLRTHKSRNLTRFRLKVGPEYMAKCYRGGDKNCKNVLKKKCFPDLSSSKINAWISFPLTRCGLKELDLCIRVRNVDVDCQLAPEIFACETLEVLKLDINLGFAQASMVQSFNLPNLKLFFLVGAFIPDNGFLTRLVSSCPLLEDLTVKGTWNNTQLTSISSPSLRRMCLHVSNVDWHHTSSVQINTPNLEYLDYADILVCQYSITNMDYFVEPNISVIDKRKELKPILFQQLLCLIIPLSNVQQLALNDVCIEVLNSGELKDQLPVFCNMKYLELDKYGAVYWHKLLSAFLHCSPVLETLGFVDSDYNHHPQYNYNKEVYVAEREFCRTTQAIISSCCRYHLKKIVIIECFGYERELDLIQFLLRHALVLEELIIIHNMIEEQLMSFESRLQNFPRASLNCSIQMQES